MAWVLRFRKLCYVEPAFQLEITTCQQQEEVEEAKLLIPAPPLVQQQLQPIRKKKKYTTKRGGEGGGGGGGDKQNGRSCIDSCCKLIGCICTTWWVVLFLFNTLPPAIFPHVPDPPAVRLKREGVLAYHPVVLVPGIVTGGLELWEGRDCAAGLFRQRLWGGSFTQLFKRPLCWLEHISLDNETGLDPPGIRVRPIPGLVAADYFAPGYFVWAVLIENLAKIGYESKNMHMAAYDWRLSFQNTEIRDKSLSRLKSKIELMYVTNGNKKVVVVPHSMGVIYFTHFLKWVETPPPMGGGGGLGWCAKHIKAIMNIGPAFLGVPKAVSNLFSAEGKDVAYVRAMAPGILDSEILGLQTLEHVMRVSRSWDSIMSLFPKGGETIWGDMDSSPEEGHDCHLVEKKLQPLQNDGNSTDLLRALKIKETVKYGRIISFGKAASLLPSSQLSIPDSKETLRNRMQTDSNSCSDVWTEYDEMSRESIQKVTEIKAYTSTTLIDLLRFVAPKMMKRAEAQFSHGIADDLEDTKYGHYKYWSNPLETKLPDAPDMEIYCMYGVGIPTERSYVYTKSPTDKCKSIPFRIDSSVDGDQDSCLKGGVYFGDGDESVPVLSAGYMCAKGWKGKTRFNPSGISAYSREYNHKPPTSFLEGRGLQSGRHVDIMGNVALIEDVLRVAGGATGTEIGGDQIFSDIIKMSEKINLKL
ncbi:hypothetical protein ACFE04_012756 [Oxalis oulophora]